MDRTNTFHHENTMEMGAVSQRPSSAPAHQLASQQQRFEGHLEGSSQQGANGGGGRPPSQPSAGTVESPQNQLVLYGAHRPPSTLGSGSTESIPLHRPSSEAIPLSPQTTGSGMSHPATQSTGSGRLEGAPSPGAQPGAGANNTGVNGITQNTGTYRVNQNFGTFYSTNNSGHFTTNLNSGLHSSLGNTGNEYIGNNAGNVRISGSAGNHVVTSNDGGNVHISDLRPGANVLIEKQHGSVTQTFPPGSVQNTLHPNGINHGPSTKPLLLDQYGTSNFTNVSANVMRNPLRYVPQYTGVAAGSALTTSVLVNNAGAIPASFAASGQAIKNYFGGA